MKNVTDNPALPSISVTHTHACTHAEGAKGEHEWSCETLCLLDCIALLKLVCPASRCSISIALDWAYSCCGDGGGQRGGDERGRAEEERIKKVRKRAAREGVHSWTQCSQMCADVVSLLADDTGHGSPRDRTRTHTRDCHITVTAEMFHNYLYCRMCLLLKSGSGFGAARSPASRLPMDNQLFLRYKSSTYSSKMVFTDHFHTEVWNSSQLQTMIYCIVFYVARIWESSEALIHVSSLISAVQAASSDEVKGHMYQSSECWWK